MSILPVVPEHPIYADYAATSPMCTVAIEVLQSHIATLSGNANPNSQQHFYGAQAHQSWLESRAILANIINALPEAIVFTSGATESNYLAINGLAKGYVKRGKHLVTVSTEHKATLNPILALRQQGFEVTVLDVDAQGQVSIETLAATIREDTTLLALSMVNNETGIMPDMAAVSALCRERGVHWHIDAVQGFAKLPIDVETLGCATLSASSHKISGPKGIGFLYVRQKPKARLSDIFAGGSQGLRPGTPAVPLASSFAAAASFTQADSDELSARLACFRARLLAKLGEHLEPNQWQIIEAPMAAHQWQGILSLRFVGVRNVALMQLLGEYLAISAGSACNATNPMPSHVLTAHGLSANAALEVVRISLGAFSRADEVEQIADYLLAAIEMLRYRAPAA